MNFPIVGLLFGAVGVSQIYPVSVCLRRKKSGGIPICRIPPPSAVSDIHVRIRVLFLSAHSGMTGYRIVFLNDTICFGPDENRACLIARPRRTNGVVFDKDIESLAVDVESESLESGGSVVFDDIVAEGVAVSAVLLVLIAEIHTMIGVSVYPVGDEDIVRVLVAD